MRFFHFNEHHCMLPAYFQESQKPLQRASEDRDRPSLSNRTPSIDSTSSNDSGKMTPPLWADTKRFSQNAAANAAATLKHLKQSSSKSDVKHVVPRPCKELGIKMESPPVVFLGQPGATTGSLCSGQLQLKTEEPLEVQEFEMKVYMEISRKKALGIHCSNCVMESYEIKRWTFLRPGFKVEKGEHEYPFSYLLLGDLPASMDGPLCKVVYKMNAFLRTKSGELISVERIPDVKRAVHPGDGLRQSMRVFPPTNITCKVELPNAIHPIGEVTAKLKMDGVMPPARDDCAVQHKWRLKKMTWYLEEKHQVIAPACSSHVVKGAKALTQATEEPRAFRKLFKAREIGRGEMKTGWKDNYSPSNPQDSTIEMEFPFGVKLNLGFVPTCDTSYDKHGIEINVSHQLIVELVVIEESTPKVKPEQHPTQTGAARILRMNFNLVLTERAGMGISWDQEEPPPYGEVPSSPPGYSYSDIRDAPDEDATATDLIPSPDYEALESLGVPVDGSVSQSLGQQ